MQQAAAQVTSHRNIPGKVEQGLWYVGALTVAFLVPFGFSSQLDLDNDLYYLVYFSVSGALLASYARVTNLDVRSTFSRSWKWSLGLGVVAAAFVVWNVLAREESTPHPAGAYFLLTIVWRGLVYGTLDALLLTALPVAIAFALFDGSVSGPARRTGFTLVALALVFAMTAVYHLGYEQFRDDGIAAPEIGNTIISIPAIASTNPLGSILAHASMHVTADIHAYETEVFLPPANEAD